ncbi:MAG: putative baseplate assembly protein [Verrucomicrobia bacterium]|nr:MAG: putative baseplate assembly protein [Verrucomicrobiota bacterium]
MIYFCCEEGRRALIRRAEQPLNGIDRLEVVDVEIKPTDPARRQRLLRVFFVKPPDGELLNALAAKQFLVSIAGGERITNIQVTNAEFKSKTAERDDHVEVEVSEPGDYSTYTLRLCDPGGSPGGDDFAALTGLDKPLASVDFSFKVECPSDLDCRETCACPPVARPEPELDYLAKDFASFRQLMLDRLSLIAPGWRERNAADLGVTLVELFAYVGDYLSYRQDAIGTEAYLGTARQRVSLRRHARLLDYRMHEGCNARVWVQVRLRDDAPQTGVVLPRNQALTARVEFTASGSQKLVAGTCFSTDTGTACVLARDEFGLKRVLDASAAEVFEPLHDVFLHPDHNEMNFYTWVGAQCCLPKGAVKATLDQSFPALKPGQVLILAERVGPHTGNPADADLTKRHAVRLTAVNPSTDPLVKTENGEDQPVTEIEWAQADALPFPLCLSSVDEHGAPVERVSVALGNLVLADHGRTLPAAEDLGRVPAPNPALAPAGDHRCGQCEVEIPREVPARYQPRLVRGGISHAESFPEQYDDSPVATVFAQSPRAAQPAVRLFENGDEIWQPQFDLIASDATAREFVAEIENDGRAHLRFGDDANGMRPAEQTRFYARYRVGNGARGNVGTGAITQIFAPGLEDVIESVTNPLPARGGIEPETMEEVRQYAPQAFKVPRRCVTPADYARRAGEHPEVQRAAATIRWTGSWHTIFLSVDRRGGRPVTAEFETALTDWLESYRLAGHDLEINGPVFVSLELSLFVCVAAGYFRSDVKAALLDAFSARPRPDGRRGFFHPDNFTFGDPVRVSAVYAAAQRVPGVQHVDVLRLRRQDAQGDPELPDDRVFKAGRLEIVRLENDPSFPDHGLLNLQLRGGR